MKNKAGLILIICMLALVGTVSATSILLSDQGTEVRTSATGGLLEEGNLTILIYDAASGGSLIYSNTFVNNITNGSWNVVINPNLTYGVTYYKDYEINGDNLNFSGADRLEFQSPLGEFNNASLFNFSLIETCPAGSSIRQVHENGSVVCEVDNDNFTKGTGGDYLYNDSLIIYFNDSLLNSTIDLRAAGVGANVSWNQSYADTLYIAQPDESNLNVNYSDSSGSSNSTTWWAGLTGWISGWFYNSGNSLAFNETKLNESIDARVSDLDTDTNASTACSTDEVLLGNGSCQSSSVYLSTFNSTYAGLINNASYLSTFNSTYDAKADYQFTTNNFNGSGWFNTTGNISANYLFGNGSFLTGIASTDTQKNTSGIYLYNNSATIFFNETQLNNTISAEGIALGFNSTFNTTYDAKADYQFTDNDFNGSGWFNTTGNISAAFFFGDGSQLQNLPEGGNLSWNQSLADTLYAPNTTAGIQALINDTGVYSTYNATYDQFAYNQTTPANTYTDTQIGLVNTTENINALGFLNKSGTNANQDINISPYNLQTANLTLSEKITFSLGEIIDNIVDGWIRITGGLDVVGDLNVSGNANLDGDLTSDWATFNNLNVTGNSYLGDIIIEADNLTVNNILPKNGGVVDVDGNLTAHVLTLDNNLYLSRLSTFPGNLTDYIPIYAKTNNQIYIKRPDGTERRLWDVGFGSVIVDEDVIFNETVNVTGEVNFFGTIYGDGSNLINITAYSVTNDSITTEKIADGNVTDTKIQSLNWTKLFDVPTGLDDGDDDTQKNTSGIYLYNNSATIFFNETKLNNTIDDRAVSEDSIWNITRSNYLINSSSILEINETKLNNTISAEGILLGFNSTFNTTYNAKADYQFTTNNFNGSGWFNTTGNISAAFFFGDGSQLQNLPSGDNASWNQSLADTLYAPNTIVGIQELINGTGVYSTYNATYTTWAYNQTAPAISYTNSVVSANNASWTSTYNATYDANQANNSFNQTLTDTLYISQTGEGNLNVNSSDYWDGLDSPLASWLSTYNVTYAGSVNNASYLSTYNATYDAKVSDNSSWNQSFADTLYAGAEWDYNQTTPANSYTDAQISGLTNTYLNLSGTNANQDVNISPYNLQTANLTLSEKITFSLGEIIDNIVDGWIRITGNLNVTGDTTIAGDATISGNITTEEIHLEQDPANHRIYDNSTCIIMQGDTSTMYIC